MPTGDSLAGPSLTYSLDGEDKLLIGINLDGYLFFKHFRLCFSHFSINYTPLDRPSRLWPTAVVAIFRGGVPGFR